MSIQLLCLRVASFLFIIFIVEKAADESNFSGTTNNRASSIQYLPISIRPEDSEYMWILDRYETSALPKDFHSREAVIFNVWR